MSTYEQRLIVMLRLLLSYEPGGNPPLTMPRGLAVERARALIEEITAGKATGQSD